MNNQDLIELVAAHVNYYKFHKTDVKYDDIYGSVSQYFRSPQDVKSFYQQHYYPALDQVFLVDRVLRMFLQDRAVMCAVQWVNFPPEPNNPENFLDIRDVDDQFIRDYVNAHQGEIYMLTKQIPDKSLYKYAKLLEKDTIMYAVITKELERRQAQLLAQPRQDSVVKPQRVIQQDENFMPSLEFRGLGTKIEKEECNHSPQGRVTRLEIVIDCRRQIFVRFVSDIDTFVMLQELTERTELQEMFNKTLFYHVEKHPQQKMIYQLNGIYFFKHKDKMYNYRQLAEDKHTQQKFNWQICKLYGQK